MCLLLKISSRDFTFSDCLSHSVNVYISRQSANMSFFTTNFRSSPSGTALLKADGRTSLPLSSILTVYSPMNFVMSVWYQLLVLCSICLRIPSFRRALDFFSGIPFLFPVLFKRLGLPDRPCVCRWNGLILHVAKVRIIFHFLPLFSKFFHNFLHSSICGSLSVPISLSVPVSLSHADVGQKPPGLSPIGTIKNKDSIF